MIDGQPDATKSDAPRQTAASRWLAVVILLAISAGSLWLALNPEWVQRFGHWGYAGAFAISLIASASIILPVPGLLVAMAMGAALNPFLLGLVTGVGSAVGETSGYLAGASGRILVSADQNSRYRRFERWMKQYGALAVFAIAVFPPPVFDLAGIAAGATRIAYWQFFVAAAAGKTIKYTVAILIAAGAFRNLLD